MYNESKYATNNAWTSSATGSLSSCANCKCGKDKKSATTNDWSATAKNGDSGCGCK